MIMLLLPIFAHEVILKRFSNQGGTVFTSNCHEMIVLNLKEIKHSFISKCSQFVRMSNVTH